MPEPARVEETPEEPAPRVIPKFSSFKPPVPSAPVPSALPKENDGQRQKEKTKEHRAHRRDRPPRSRSRERTRQDGDEDRRKHRHRSRDRHRVQDDRKPRHNRRRRSPPSTDVVLGKPARSPSPEEWDAPKKDYWVDTKGDPDNLVYGTIHRYSIPDYRRTGSGSVVGLPAEVKIDREKGDGKELVLRVPGQDSTGRGRGARHSFAKLGEEGVKKLRVKRDETGLEEEFKRGLDFVPFSTRSKKRKGREGDESESEGGDWLNYRSIERLKNGDVPEDKDLEYASESASEVDYISAAGWTDQKQMVALSRKVDAEPKNVTAWLDYVDYHDKNLRSRGRRATAAERKSTAEIKLDILSKALDKCPGNEKLLLRYMAVAESIWDPQKLLAQWKKFLDENPTATELWTTYINFRQTDFLSFTYPECLKCFHDCLALLQLAALKARIGSEERQRLETNIVYVFLRATLLMRDSGYKENAIAALQAMLELNLLRPAQMLPPSTPSEHDTLLGEFEKFWDSEVLRVGETGASGWAAHVAARENGETPAPVTRPVELTPLDDEDPFGSWADAETEWSRVVTMPARTIDEAEEDDPYRVVLFSDLKSLLFCLSGEVGQKRLVDAFLLFHHLPTLYQLNLQPSGASESVDPFLRNDLAAVGDRALDQWFWPQQDQKPKEIVWNGMEPEKNAGIDSNATTFRPSNFPVGPDTMFSGVNGWFHRMDDMSAMNTDNALLVEETIRLLVTACGEDLALCHLALVWENRRNDFKKVAKSLLKRFKTSIRLWSAYSQLEWLSGNLEAARNVFCTALGMSKGFPEAARRDTIVLWTTWIWAEMSLGQYDEALRLVLSIESGKPVEKAPTTVPGNVPGSVLLKARRHLQEQRDHLLSLQYVAHAGLYSEAHSLLEYISSNRSLTSALSAHDTFLTALSSRSLTGSSSSAHEQHLLRHARLLHHHATTARPFKPLLLRQALEDAIALFPHNTVFLSLYAWNEARTRIENRVRTLLRDHVLVDGKESVIGWTFAIWAELQLPHRYNVHAVRSLFERAVECEATKSSIALWRLYAEFELREKEPRRAKDVLFRAVRNCPWSKDVIMLAFTRLRPALQNEELRKLLSIMSTEKELRTHDVTELEDMLDEQEKARGGGGGGQRMEIVLPDDPDTDEEMEDD